MSDAEPVDHPVLLFDGVCNLCTGSVQFVIERDPEGLFRFAPLQSDVAESLLADSDVDSDDLETVVLVDDGEYYTKSSAAIRTAQHLGGTYRVLGPFRFVPKVLRDLVYDLIAANRYWIFGKRESCMRPTPELKDRFLAGEPAPAVGSDD